MRLESKHTCLRETTVDQSINRDKYEHDHTEHGCIIENQNTNSSILESLPLMIFSRARRTMKDETEEEPLQISCGDMRTEEAR